MQNKRPTNTKITQEAGGKLTLQDVEFFYYHLNVLSADTRQDIASMSATLLNLYRQYVRKFVDKNVPWSIIHTNSLINRLDAITKQMPQFDFSLIRADMLNGGRDILALNANDILKCFQVIDRKYELNFRLMKIGIDENAFHNKDVDIRQSLDERKEFENQLMNFAAKDYSILSQKLFERGEKYYHQKKYPEAIRYITASMINEIKLFPSHNQKAIISRQAMLVEIYKNHSIDKYQQGHAEDAKRYMYYAIIMFNRIPLESRNRVLESQVSIVWRHLSAINSYQADKYLYAGNYVQAAELYKVAVVNFNQILLSSASEVEKLIELAKQWLSCMTKAGKPLTSELFESQLAAIDQKPNDVNKDKHKNFLFLMRAVDLCEAADFNAGIELLNKIENKSLLEERYLARCNDALLNKSLMSEALPLVDARSPLISPLTSPQVSLVKSSFDFSKASTALKPYSR